MTATLTMSFQTAGQYDRRTFFANQSTHTGLSASCDDNDECNEDEDEDYEDDEEWDDIEDDEEWDEDEFDDDMELDEDEEWEEDE